MMKYVIIAVVFGLIFSFTSNKENLKTNIQFENEFTIINSDTLFFNKNVRGIQIKKLETILREKSYKVIPKDSSNIIFYYFKKTGIICTASKVNVQEYPINFEILFSNCKQVKGKVKAFNGDLRLFGIKLDKSTTFINLFREPKIHSLIDYSYYAKDTSTSIIINTNYNSYSIRFNGKDKNSVIESISSNF